MIPASKNGDPHNLSLNACYLLLLLHKFQTLKNEEFFFPSLVFTMFRNLSSTFNTYDNAYTLYFSKIIANITRLTISEVSSLIYKT